jgi:2-methoxy-6-polyprenyl-1,4-benzoquinol methylase
LGEIFGRNWNSYQYLVESIRRFPDQQDFKVMIESAGFTLVEFTNLMDGIAAIHVGYKK